MRRSHSGGDAIHPHHSSAQQEDGERRRGPCLPTEMSTLENLTATVAALEASVAANTGALENLPGSVDTFYLIIVGALVFFMQAGFGLLEAGSVRTKNTKNILLKNLLDACMGAIVWWAWGFAAAVKLPLLRPHANHADNHADNAPLIRPTRPIIDPVPLPHFRSTRRARLATSSSAARTKPRASSPPAGSPSPRRGGPSTPREATSRSGSSSTSSPPPPRPSSRALSPSALSWART